MNALEEPLEATTANSNDTASMRNNLGGNDNQHTDNNIVDEQIQGVNKMTLFHSDSTGHDGNTMEDIQQRSFRARRAVSKRFSILLSTEQHNQTDERNFYGPYRVRT